MKSKTTKIHYPQEEFMKSKQFRWIPLLILLILLGLSYYFKLHHYLSVEQIKKHRLFLLDFVQGYPNLAPLVFLLVYIIATALSIPGDIFLTILAGFLFPQPYCTILVIIGATIGAIALFLIARTAFGDFLKDKAGPFLKKMQAGFQENEVSYLLFLRFVPIFPFWLVNIAPAIFGVSLYTFAWTTFIGIIPGSFVFTQIGAGLGSILDSQEPFSLSSALTLEVRIALIALGLFALVPIAYKKFRKKKSRYD